MDNFIFIFTESKLKGKVHSWLTNKFDSVQVFTTGLNSGHLSAGVVIIMNSFLARHVCKVSEAGKINLLIVKTVNESSFIVLCGDFNEDGSKKCTSFKKCVNLGLVNSLAGCPEAKMPTWVNSRGTIKTIDYVFVSPNLVGVLIHCGVLDVGEFFDMNHKTVLVSMGLDELLDNQLCSIHKQANRNWWKFNIKNADEAKWLGFRNAMATNASMVLDAFGVAVRFSDLDAMWDIVHKIMVLSVESTFMKSWFKDFDVVFTKELSKFYKLELLVSKLVKALRLVFSDDFASLLKMWDRLNITGASTVKFFFLEGFGFDVICFVLAKARKAYRASKLLESKHAENSCIKLAISKRMESFELDKNRTIRSVLEHPFCKVVLDHLVINDKLILEPGLVKSGVDVIIEEWTRKREVVSDIFDEWAYQYWPLNYVFDGAFSGVMCLISFDKMFAIVMDLPNGKAAGLSGISNEFELVPGPWREALVSMIPKLYEWEGVLMNTHPIALIKTAHKILFKVFFDRISSACSTFNVLCGDNFSVLKGTMTQSLIFAVSAVVEDALEKNRKLWLVLQNMRKTYDSVGWEHLRRSLIRIKMCNRFIRFFGGIHNGHVNRVMTDFGLTNEYYVHDGLDQDKVFSPLLWRIFYNSLLCEVKRQKTDSQTGLTLFFAAGAFVDDTIWVDSSQAAT
ncbi:hypothetical protein G9A89_016047 [Geosiphon pyriformis]|nr:hypothetical protein G9A89_016047 [Geosiphon pyriformis]